MKARFKTLLALLAALAFLFSTLQQAGNCAGERANDLLLLYSPIHDDYAHTFADANGVQTPNPNFQGTMSACVQQLHSHLLRPSRRLQATKAAVSVVTNTDGNVERMCRQTTNPPTYCTNFLKAFPDSR